jgi:hypothetical protein
MSMSSNSNLAPRTIKRPDFFIALIIGAVICGALVYLRSYFFGPIPFEDAVERAATIGIAIVVLNALVTRFFPH